MVINNDPSYAYLLESNMDVDQKLVMAHVFGHVDFFKNNFMFRHTNRKMIGPDGEPRHARPPLPGQARASEQVEDFIDRCLSLENLIDYQSPYVKRRPDAARRGRTPSEKVAKGFKTEREYMREFINPPEFLAAQQKRLDEEAARRRSSRSGRSATCCCSCSSTRRSSAGSTTCSRSSARRRTTSPRRARRRS